MRGERRFKLVIIYARTGSISSPFFLLFPFSTVITIAVRASDCLIAKLAWQTRGQPASGQSELESRESGKTEEKSGMEIAGDARCNSVSWFRFVDDKKIVDRTLPIKENERDNFAVRRANRSGRKGKPRRRNGVEENGIV